MLLKSFTSIIFPSRKLIILFQFQIWELNLFKCFNMAMENIRKRKHGNENRNFQEELVENYGFINNNGKSFCVICNITIKNYKVSNLHRHYETNHPHFSTQYSFNSKLRTEKLKSLQSGLFKQQGHVTSFSRKETKLVFC